MSFANCLQTFTNYPSSDIKNSYEYQRGFIGNTKVATKGHIMFVGTGQIEFYLYIFI